MAILKISLPVYDDWFIDSCREFLSPTARDPVNVDCHVAENVRQNVETSCDRCIFDVAVVSRRFFSCTVVSTVHMIGSQESI